MCVASLKPTKESLKEVFSSPTVLKSAQLMKQTSVVSMLTCTRCWGLVCIHQACLEVPALIFTLKKIADITCLFATPSKSLLPHFD